MSGEIDHPAKNPARVFAGWLLLFFFCVLRDWDSDRLAAAGLTPLEVRGFAYILLAATTGLHFSVHGFAVLAWPVYAAVFVRQVLRREVSWKIAPAAMCAWLLAMLPLGSLVSARALDAYFRANPKSLGDRKIGTTLASLVDVYTPSLSLQAVLSRYSDRPWYVVRPFPGYVPDAAFLDYAYEPHGHMFRMKMK